MSDSPQSSKGSISTHILPTSANLVGVCMMVISVVKLLPVHGWVGLIDDVLLWDSVLFLVSAGLSYASMRVHRLGARLENLAEIVFLLGLVVIIAAAAILSYDVGSVPRRG